jgi:hypothetical protein
MHESGGLGETLAVAASTLPLPHLPVVTGGGRRANHLHIGWRVTDGRFSSPRTSGDGRPSAKVWSITLDADRDRVEVFVSGL